MVDDRLQRIGSALRIADQHEARRSRPQIHRHDRVADLARVVRGTGQGIDLDQHLFVTVLAQVLGYSPGGCSHCAKQS